MPVRLCSCLVLLIAMWATPCAAHVGGGIAVGPDGNIYCVHTKRSQVLRISPVGIAVDEARTLYVMDQTARETWGFSIRRVVGDGTVSTLAVIPE